MNVLVSVIIPVYNGAATVGPAIESALAQDFENVEIIVVDDGSTDLTPQILDEFRASVKVIRRENGGICAARNTAVSAASGDYIALLDADDLWRPGRLRRTIEALERNPTAVMSFCDFISMTESGALLKAAVAGRAPSHQDLLMRGWPVVPSAVTIRRSALAQVGGFCEEFKGCGGGEDQYMWLRLSEYGEFEYVPQPLALHRRTPPIQLVDKYEPGRQTFVRLVRARYGALASNRIREGKDFFAGLLVAAAVKEIEAGNPAQAFWMLRRALRYRPFLLFRPAWAARLFKVRNARRGARSLFKFRSDRR